MTSEFGGVSDASVLPSVVRTLLVDDDVALCRQLAAGLARAGCQAVIAHDAERALVQARQTPPDVAIVDLGMPGTSGLVVIQQLKALYGNAVHVIVLTGQDDEASRAAAFEAGADEHLIKPITHAELRRRVAAAVRNLRTYMQVRLEKEATERRLVYGQEASALLAHDLNNGLSVAHGNLSYLLDVVKGDAEVMEALMATIRSVRRMSSLVANFVDIARFEDAAVKPTAARVDVHELLQSVIEVNASSVKQGAKLEIDCPPDLDAWFDRGLVERVLHNLLGNSLRYCVAGGRIVLAGRRWVEGEDRSVELVVSNTGPLVPEEIRGNLFNKYVHDKAGKRGMGLYFCRLVAEAHGGRIDYEPGADGPRFLLRLPGHA